MIKYLAAVLLTLSTTACSSGFRDSLGQRHPFGMDLYTVKQPAPTVLISHGSACVVDQYRDWARQLNRWGYNAIVIDHCTARGIYRYTGGFPPQNLQPADKARDYVILAQWARSQPWHRGGVAVIGFSRGGGGVTNLVNRRYHQHHRSLTDDQLRSIDAAVAFYPSCSPFPPPEEPYIPTLIHHGLADDLAKPRLCGYGRLRHPNYQIRLYEGAHHTFDDSGPEITGWTVSGEPFTARRYQRAADEASRRATKEFLDRALKP